MKYWVPPLLYMALIFVVSSLEQSPLPMPEFEWLTIDKLYHFVEYAILGGLLAIAFVKAKPAVIPLKLIWLVAALLSILYGASDDSHCEAIRHSSPVDSLRSQTGWQMCSDQLQGCWRSISIIEAISRQPSALSKERNVHETLAFLLMADSR